VWTEDEAGPYQTIPYPGYHWHPAGGPVRYPHEYVREGTAKQLTLFHPASGAVRVKGVRRCPNAVLHPWLEAELAAILAALPAPAEVLGPEENRRRWERWQEGLTVRISLPADLPPRRMLLVLDNLTGHHTVDFVLWLFAHGVMPRSTPLGGSRLNELAQRAGSTWPSRSSASSSGGRWTASIRAPPKTSSPGWRRRPAGGTGRRRPSPGAARAAPDGSAPGGDAIASAAPAPTPADRFPAPSHPSLLATSNPTDPVVGQLACA